MAKFTFGKLVFLTLAVSASFPASDGVDAVKLGMFRARINSFGRRPSSANYEPTEVEKKVQDDTTLRRLGEVPYTAALRSADPAVQASVLSSKAVKEAMAGHKQLVEVMVDMNYSKEHEWKKAESIMNSKAGVEAIIDKTVKMRSPASSASNSGSKTRSPASSSGSQNGGQDSEQLGGTSFTGQPAVLEVKLPRTNTRPTKRSQGAVNRDFFVGLAKAPLTVPVAALGRVLS